MEDHCLLVFAAQFPGRYGVLHIKTIKINSRSLWRSSLRFTRSDISLISLLIGSRWFRGTEARDDYEHNFCE